MAQSDVMCSLLTREAHITAEGNITHEVRITFRVSGTHRSKNEKAVRRTAFSFLVAEVDLNLTTYRTVRIVAARRSVRSLLRLLALRCIAAQKRFLTVFALLTGYSPSARSARTHNLEGRGAQSRNRDQKERTQTTEW